MPSLSRSVDLEAGHGPGLQDILEHPSQMWHKADSTNRNYLSQNLTRLMLRAALVSELWSTVMDPKWMYAQLQVGGLPALKHDFKVLEICLRKYTSPDHFEDILTSVRSIKRCFASSADFFKTPGMLSFSVLSRILRESRQKASLRVIHNKIISSTPKPCLVPVTTWFDHVIEALEAEADLRTSPRVSLHLLYDVDYSPCGRYFTASMDCSVAVVDAETRDCLRKLTFHTKSVSAVNFISAAQIVSASHDCTIAVWHWQSTESPPVVLYGHSGAVLDIAISSDGTKIYSASSDSTLKVWNVTGGQAIESFPRKAVGTSLSVHGDKVAAIAPSTAIHELGIPELQVLALNHLCGGYPTEPSVRRVGVSAVTFSGNGKYIAFAYTQNCVHVLRTDCWREAFEPLKGHTAEVTSLDFRPDSHRLV